MQKQSPSTDNNDITSSSLEEKNAFFETIPLHSLLSLLLETVRPLYENAIRAKPPQNIEQISMRKYCLRGIVRVISEYVGVYTVHYSKNNL